MARSKNQADSKEALAASSAISPETLKTIATQAFGFGGEQLCNVARTLKQMSPGSSYAEVMRESILKRGLLTTLLSGSTATATQIFSKQFIRGGVVAASNKALQTLSPQEFLDAHKSVKENFGTAMMAATDPIIQTTLEAVRTKSITSSKALTTKEAINNPFKGFLPTAIRQWIFFVTMLGIDKATKQYYETEDLSLTQRTANAIATSAIYVPTTGPVDTVRARMQANGSTINTMREGFAQLWKEANKEPLKFIKITGAGGGVRFGFNCFSALGGMAAIDWADKVTESSEKSKGRF